MRSALDHAAYELARHHVGKLNDQQEAATELPICIDEAAFQGWFAKGKKGIRNGLYGDVERKALRCVQPFARGMRLARSALSRRQRPRTTCLQITPTR